MNIRIGFNLVRDLSKTLTSVNSLFFSPFVALITFLNIAVKQDKLQPKDPFSPWQLMM